jgi:hypothetical protein
VDCLGGGKACIPLQLQLLLHKNDDVPCGSGSSYAKIIADWHSNHAIIWQHCSVGIVKGSLISSKPNLKELFILLLF